MKNKKNMGFSLVELIVVVAIMAVLVGVLAPAYLGYVEKTRKGTDENAAEEIRRAVETAIAGDLKVYDEVKGGVTLTIADGAKITTIAPAAAGGSTGDETESETPSAGASTSEYANLVTALTEVFGDKLFDCKSKAYDGGTLSIKVNPAATGSSCTVEATLKNGDNVWESNPTTK